MVNGLLALDDDGVTMVSNVSCTRARIPSRFKIIEPVIDLSQMLLSAIS